MHLGNFIKQKRLEKNLTMEQLGNMIGKHKSFISKLESNKIKSLKNDSIKLLAEALDVPIVDLFKGFDADGISIKDYKIEKISSEDFVTEVLGLLGETLTEDQKNQVLGLLNERLTEQQVDYVSNIINPTNSDEK